MPGLKFLQLDTGHLLYITKIVKAITIITQKKILIVDNDYIMHGKNTYQVDSKLLWVYFFFVMGGSKVPQKKIS